MKRWIVLSGWCVWMSFGMIGCGSPPETDKPQEKQTATSPVVTTGTYKPSDVKNTKEDCKANRNLNSSFKVIVSNDTIRIEEWAMEGNIKNGKFLLVDRKTRDFSPEYDCAMELKIRVEGKITGKDQMDIKLTETLSIEGSGHTECPDAAASLGYNEFSGLQCSIGKTFRLKKQ